MRGKEFNHIAQRTQACLSPRARIFHEFTPWRDCDHGYRRPSGLELPHHRIIIQVVGDRPADTVYFLQVVRKELDLHRFGVV